MQMVRDRVGQELVHGAEAYREAIEVASVQGVADYIRARAAEIIEESPSDTAAVLVAEVFTGIANKLRHEASRA